MKIQEIIQLLKNGKVGVIPTDTIYGIVASALDPELVEKIYKLKKRNTDKPFIILISSIYDLEKFDVKLTEKQKEFLEKNWPNPLSVLLPSAGDKWKYLHRGTNSLAFRMPKDEELIELLEEFGPLVAPSANIEGEKPAETTEEAKEYFGNFVNFYIDRGTIKGEPSTIIKLNDDATFEVLREGSYKV